MQTQSFGLVLGVLLLVAGCSGEDASPTSPSAIPVRLAIAPAAVPAATVSSAAANVHPAGTLTNLSGSCPNVTFTIGGIVVRTSAATVFDDGGCAALRNGDQVRVDAVQQPDGSVLATEVEVDKPDANPAPSGVALALEIDPDDWRLEWASGSRSGSGGATLTAEIRGSGAEQIATGSVTLSGPAGAISPATTKADVDHFEADFAKTEAIGLVGNPRAGGSVIVTVSGRLSDGTPFSLAYQVTIRK